MGYPAAPGGVKPNNYLAWSVVSIILFWPLGIAAIINATKVDPAWQMGNAAMAQEHSNKAKRFSMIATIIGAVCFVIQFIIGWRFGLSLFGTNSVCSTRAQGANSQNLWLTTQFDANHEVPLHPSVPVSCSADHFVGSGSRIHRPPRGFTTPTASAGLDELVREQQCNSSDHSAHRNRCGCSTGLSRATTRSPLRACRRFDQFAVIVL